MSALASVFIAILYVRTLDTSEYAAYATAIALAGLLVQLTSTGLARLGFRYGPGLAEVGNFASLAKLFRFLLVVRLGAISVASIVIISVWPWLSEKLGATQGLLHILLAQGLTQTLLAHWLTVSQLLMMQRTIAFSVSIAALAKIALAAGLTLCMGTGFSAETAVTILAISELISTAILSRKYKSISKKDNDGNTGSQGQSRLPSLSEATKFIAGIYGSTQVSAVIHPRVQIIIAAALLPDEVVAGYAFIRNLVEQLANFMPGRLFRQLLEPFMMGRYRDGRKKTELAFTLTLLSKANLSIIGPVAFVFAIGGESLLGYLTGGKYLEQAELFGLLFMGLTLSTYRTAVGAVVNASGNLGTIVVAAFAGAIGVVVCLWLPLARHGVWLLAITETVYTLVFLSALRWRLGNAFPGIWAPLRFMTLVIGYFLLATMFGMALGGFIGVQQDPYAIGGLVAFGGLLGALLMRWLCVCNSQELSSITAVVPKPVGLLIRRLARTSE